MVNLEQLRAKNALLFSTSIHAGAGDGKPDAVVKKTASRIMQNGFLGALAFAIDKEEGMSDTFAAILYHLLDPNVRAPIDAGKFAGFARAIDLSRNGEKAKLPVSGQGKALEELMTSASSCSAAELQSITDEAMSYLAFLRRFVNS